MERRILADERDQLKKEQKSPETRNFAFPRHATPKQRHAERIRGVLRNALKTRHFTTALYRRDTRLPIANMSGCFIASVKIGVL
jgi:hypothetical protein